MERCFMLVPKGTSECGPVPKTPLSARPHESSVRELKRCRKKPRAKLACQTCRARKVRCDVIQQSPCSNCRAYAVECEIATAKRGRPSTSEDVNQSHKRSPPNAHGGSDCSEDTISPTAAAQDLQLSNGRDKPGRSSLAPETEDFALSRAPLRIFSKDLSGNPKRTVTYRGESSDLHPLSVDNHVLQRGITALAAQPTAGLPSADCKFLGDRGAFLLPPRWLCEELIDAYFTWVAPIVPVINRHDFMQRFGNPERRPPSYLLMQSVLLAACRVCRHPLLLDADGSTKTVSRLFYKRAKALYDSNYESDQPTVVQALVLLGWYWEGPEGIMDNSSYWTQVAITVAQGLGMHRSADGTSISETDKRLWKRIWWTLFCRDHTLALSRGRPFSIRTEDTDIEALAAEDFVEQNAGVARFPCDRHAVRFFLHFTELCNMIGVILQQRHLFSADPAASFKTKLECYTGLEAWYQKLPEQFRWDPSRHEFWPSVLQLYYYSTLCLLHLLPTHRGTSAIDPPDVSRDKPRHFNSASTDASMISCILAKLRAFGQIPCVPCFTVYSSCIAMVIHTNEILCSTDDERVRWTHCAQIEICMNALKDLSKSWLLAEVSFNIASPIVDEVFLGNRPPVQE